MDAVKTVGAQVVRQTAGTADPRHADNIFWFNVVIFQYPLQTREDTEVAAMQDLAQSMGISDGYVRTLL